jgi:cob(I)alamin adenosyltransferase
MRITKVYTRAGDNGETSLVGGKRVSKASLRVEAYGDIDELNSVLGVARAEIDDAEVDEVLRRIQNQLFTLGADLASPAEVAVPRVNSEWVPHIEQLIDHFNAQLPPLEEFILPGGRRGAALLHLARTVCRRAERHTVALSHQEPVGEAASVYINRLSDLLFVLARLVNRRRGGAEEQVVFQKAQDPKPIDPRPKTQDPRLEEIVRS